MLQVYSDYEEQLKLNPLVMARMKKCAGEAGADQSAI